MASATPSAALQPSENTSLASSASGQEVSDDKRKLILGRLQQLGVTASVLSELSLSKNRPSPMTKALLAAAVVVLSSEHIGTRMTTSVLKISPSAYVQWRTFIAPLLATPDSIPNPLWKATMELAMSKKSSMPAPQTRLQPTPQPSVPELPAQDAQSRGSAGPQTHGMIRFA